jgi:hypothetical protein
MEEKYIQRILHLTINRCNSVCPYWRSHAPGYNPCRDWYITEPYCSHPEKQSTIYFYTGAFHLCPLPVIDNNAIGTVEIGPANETR